MNAQATTGFVIILSLIATVVMHNFNLTINPEWGLLNGFIAGVAIVAAYKLVIKPCFRILGFLIKKVKGNQAA